MSDQLSIESAQVASAAAAGADGLNSAEGPAVNISHFTAPVDSKNENVDRKEALQFAETRLQDSNMVLLASGNNGEPPISLIPDEILIAIFEMIMGGRNDWTPPQAILKQLHDLSIVSSHWRAVAKGTPLLWARLSSQDPLPLVREALKLSGDHPLHISAQYLADNDKEIDAKSRAAVIGFLKMVVPHADRWHSANLRLPSIDFIQRHLQVPAAIITKLDLDLHFCWGPGFFDIFNGAAPCLIDLTITGQILNPTSGILAGLRSLKLLENASTISFTNFSLVVSEIPQLIELDVDGNTWNLADMPSSPSTISLPHLKTLILRLGYQTMHPVLSIIKAPVCANFTVRSNIFHTPDISRSPQSVALNGREAMVCYLHTVLATHHDNPLKITLLPTVWGGFFGTRCVVALRLGTCQSNGATFTLRGLLDNKELDMAYSWMIEGLGELGIGVPPLECEIRGAAALIWDPDVKIFNSIAARSAVNLTFFDIETAKQWFAVLSRENDFTASLFWLFPATTRIGLSGCEIDPTSVLKMVEGRYGLSKSPKKKTKVAEVALPIALDVLDVGMVDRADPSAWSKVKEVVGEGVLV